MDIFQQLLNKSNAGAGTDITFRTFINDITYRNNYNIVYETPSIHKLVKQLHITLTQIWTHPFVESSEFSVCWQCLTSCRNPF